MTGDVSFAPRRRTIRTGWGGIAGLTFPTVLVVISLSVGFRHAGGPGDLASSFLGALLFLVAAPTAWLFAIPFIEVTRFTVITVGVLTSGVVWFVAGRAIAARSRSWGVWMRRYAAICVTWTAATLLLFALFASLG